MQQKRILLCLNDPLNPAPNTKGLVFMENESFLSQAQTALWQARREGDWVCIWACGTAVYIALALAAQLSLDRLVLTGMPDPRIKLPRELNRLKAFARRNLALITAEMLLVGADDIQIRSLLRGTGRCRVCALDDLPREMYTAPWTHICGGTGESHREYLFFRSCSRQ